MKTQYPQSNMSVCVAMLLTNLALPEWVTVVCNQPLSAHVVCVLPQPSNESSSVNTSRNDLFEQKLVVFNSSCILVQDKCFLFLWVTHENPSISREAHKRTDILIEKTNITNLNYFSTLFDAVWVRFPVIISLDLKFYTETCRLVESDMFMNRPSLYQFISYPFKDNSFKGLYITPQGPVSAHIGANLLKCEKAIISVLSICDQITDCPDDSVQDENACECLQAEGYKKVCKYLNHSNGVSTCSRFYIQKADGLCFKYSFAILSEKENTVYAVPEQKLETDLSVNIKAEISLQTATLFTHNNKGDREDFFCQESGKLPCSQSQQTCFHLHDVCYFKLLADKLYPCKTGQHLTNCNKFQCNMKFKCRDAYCIPWMYVCNGKWDCPFGLDEDPSCNLKRQCTNMFKCKQAGICIHLHDVCDDKGDCPLHDDEQLCQLERFNCPRTCQCLAFAMICFKVNTDHGFYFPFKLPWHAIFVEQCGVLFTKNILSSLEFISVLFLQNNNLTSFCDLHLRLQHAIVIDAGYNRHEVLTKNCFENLRSLKSIKFNSNNLSKIQPNAFNNLTTLLVLDLSENNLLDFDSDFLCGSFHVKIILLHTNSLANIKHSTLTGLRLLFISTTNSALCCGLPQNSTCQVNDQCHLSCSHLLVNTTGKVFFWLTFVAIFALNITSGLSQRRAFQNQKRKSTTPGHLQGAKAYCILVEFGNFNECIFALYFGALCVVDQIVGDAFAFYEEKWRTSIFCFCIFAVYIQHHIVSPNTMVVLSVSRLMVVMYPMNTKFKDAKFVQKLSVTANVFCVLAAALVISLAAGLNSKVLNKLCSSSSEFCDFTWVVVITRWVLISWQVVCLIVIIIVNIKMLTELEAARQKVQACKSQRKNTLPIGQCVTLVLSSVICWVPPCVTYFVCSLTENCSESVFLWTAVTMEPLNSIVVPQVLIIMNWKNAMQPKFIHQNKNDQQK